MDVCPVGLGAEEMAAEGRRLHPAPVVSIGWCRHRLVNAECERLVAEMVACCGDKSFKTVSGRSVGRPEGRLYPFGGTVYAKGDGKFCPLLDLPHTAVRAVAEGFGDAVAGEVNEPLHWLNQAGAECIRFDATVDFVGHEIDPMWAAYEAGDYLPWRGADHRDSRQRGEGGSRTIYFGGIWDGGSGVRVYEKGSQTGEAWPILRVEYQAKLAQATAFYKHVFGTDQGVRAGVTSFLPSKLDFLEGFGASRVDKAKQKNARRDCARYAWWEELLRMLPLSVPFKCGEFRDTDFDGMLKWVQRIFPKLWAKLSYAVGPELAFRFLNMTEGAGDSLSPEEKSEIDAWRLSSSGELFKQGVW